MNLSRWFEQGRDDLSCYNQGKYNTLHLQRNMAISSIKRLFVAYTNLARFIIFTFFSSFSLHFNPKPLLFYYGFTYNQASFIFH
jgi:hypothetical protein